MAGPEAPIIEIDGLEIRDLNKNGILDPYEDIRVDSDARVENLLSQMTLEEKAGMMFINMVVVGQDGKLSKYPNRHDMTSLLKPINAKDVMGLKMNHFNLLFTPSALEIARWSNEIQKLAEKTRLGIPITIASDPRHSFRENIAIMTQDGFSKWCEPLGLAAARDSLLTWQYGDIARQEYRAIGIHCALHPMVDLATEPRWGRIIGTFGEDAKLTSRMAFAYIKGFQGDTLGPTSVACMTKHFPGGGPQLDGLDPHLEIGKDQVYPGNNFEYHLIPFVDAVFPANTSQIMPYYGIPVDQFEENIGFGFNKEVITGMLREKYGYDGVICTDWGLITDKSFMGMNITKSKSWGVGHLSAKERLLKALDAGVDQIGGEECPELIIELVKENKLTEERIDQSVRRLLRDKFRLGLFDNPYLNIEQTSKILGRKDFNDTGKESQRRSMVLLKNEKEILPLSDDQKIYVQNIDPIVATNYGAVVKDVEEADVVLIRLEAPYEIVGKGIVAGMIHQGRLDYKTEDLDPILDILESKPAVVDIFMDRPAVIPEIAKKSAALSVSFGSDDEAFLDLVFGRFSPSGKLPFELPSSMEAVEKQFEDVHFDSENPLFPFGFGLSYENLRDDQAN